MKCKLEIYGLAVCFASIICLVISGGIADYALLTITAPSLTISASDYEEHQTNDSYWRYNKCCKTAIADGKKTDIDKDRPSENELTQQRIASYDATLGREIHMGLQSLMQSLIFIFVGLITLISHWFIAKSARDKNA